MTDRGAVATGLFLATDFAPEVELPSGWGPEVEWLLAFNARGTRLAVSYRYGKHILVFNPCSRREVARLADFKYLQGLAFLSTENGAVLQRAAPPVGRELTWAVPSADWSLFAAATPGGVVIWPSDRAPAIPRRGGNQ
jgi:hypothetical protein